MERSELGGRRQLGLATARMQKREGDGWKVREMKGVTCDMSRDWPHPFLDQGSYAAATMAVEVLLEEGRWKEGARSFVACRTSARLFAGAY